MRPAEPILSPAPARWLGCGRLQVDAGRHQLRPVPGWAADELVLRDPLGDYAAPPAALPGVRVQQERGPRSTVHVTGATAPYHLVTGQAYDPAWRATLDGRDLGPPVLLDGYAAGWRVDAPGDHTISVEYAPQRVTDLALLGSAAVALGSAALIGVVRLVPPTGPAPGPAAPAPAPARLRRPGAAGSPGARRSGGAAAWLRWAGVVAVAWVVGGTWLAVPAAVLAAWHRRRPPPARWLVAAAAVALLAVPVVWWVLRPDLAGRVLPRIVLDNPWPGRLAAVGLLLLVVGVLRADRADPAGRGDR
jgi:arabinofuranan 3-O-arabinosyltransferase